MILVAGASGFVGRTVLRRLSDRPARALVRRRSSVPWAEGKVEIVEGDLTEPETLGPALQGIEVVIHCAAITGDRKEPVPGAYDAINRVGTQNLMIAASRAGVRRVVGVSGLGARPARLGTYMATRWGMEEALRNSGLPFTILQPSVLFGGGAPFIRALAGLVRLPVTPVVGGGTRFQPFWVEDLASCLLMAAAEPRWEGQAVALGGPEHMTMREMLERIAAVLGRSPLYVPVPLELAAVQAHVLTALMPHPPLTPAAIDLLQSDNITDLDACERNFEFQPRSLRTELEEVAAGTRDM